MVYEAEAGPYRWLMKAIRDSAGEIFSQFDDLSEPEARWRPPNGEWCLNEVAAHLRDADELHVAQVEHALHPDGPYLPHEALDILPSERNYLDQQTHGFLFEYSQARRDLIWTLRSLSGTEWEMTAAHRYRGLVSVTDLVRSVHEHDLEHLYQCKRLRLLYAASQAAEVERPPE